MEKKSLGLKAFRGGIVVILSMVLMLFLVSCKEGSGSSGNSGIDRISENVVQGKYGVFYNMEGKVYRDYEANAFLSNGDKSVCTYTNYTDTNNLYYMTSDVEPKHVAKSVDFYVLSYSGDYIAYSTYGENHGVTGDIFIYCIKDGTVTEIATEVKSKDFCISPTGETVAYIGVDDKIHVSGINVEDRVVTDEGFLPMAITNDGNVLYYIDDNYGLYASKDNKSIVLKADDSYTVNIWFNNSVTEIIYSDQAHTYYFTDKMDEPKVIGDSYTSYIYTSPDAIMFRMPLSAIYPISFTVGLDTLKGVLVANQGTYWLNDKEEPVFFTRYKGPTQISGDGKSIIHCLDQTLYKIDKLSDKMEEEVLHKWSYGSVNILSASEDLSTIYMTGDELYYLKGKNEVELITDNIDIYEKDGSMVAYNEAMKKIFFIETDGTLCYAGTNSKSKKKVESNVWDVKEFMDGVVYAVGEEGRSTYYYMVDEEPIELFKE